MTDQSDVPDRPNRVPVDIQSFLRRRLLSDIMAAFGYFLRYSAEQASRRRGLRYLIALQPLLQSLIMRLALRQTRTASDGYTSLNCLPSRGAALGWLAPTVAKGIYLRRHKPEGPLPPAPHSAVWRKRAAAAVLSLAMYLQPSLRQSRPSRFRRFQMLAPVIGEVLDETLGGQRLRVLGRSALLLTGVPLLVWLLRGLDEFFKPA